MGKTGWFARLLQVGGSAVAAFLCFPAEARVLERLCDRLPYHFLCAQAKTSFVLQDGDDNAVGKVLTFLDRNRVIVTYEVDGNDADGRIIALTVGLRFIEKLQGNIAFETDDCTGQMYSFPNSFDPPFSTYLLFDPDPRDDERELPLYVALGGGEPISLNYRSFIDFDTGDSSTSGQCFQRNASFGVDLVAIELVDENLEAMHPGPYTLQERRN